jgi:type IV pilus assembly protein PilM
MPEEDLRSAISFEAQDHIPMALEEAVFDYVVLGPLEEGSDLDRILVVAAHKEMIDRYSAAVRASGLKPAGIDVKALALTRSTLPDTFFDEGATLLLDVGTEITNLAITQGGNPTLTRFIPSGLDRFVESVSEATKLPEDQAEREALNPRVRLGYDAQSAPEDADDDQEAPAVEGGDAELEDFDPALVYDVRRGVEEAVQALAEDVLRSIEYHHSQPGTREVTGAFVSGEGALIPGLDAYLGELLGVTTRRGHPVEKLGANRSNVSDEQLAAMEPVLAVALGLAMEDE